MSFRPMPKPVKKEKERMTSYEFRKKYGSKLVTVTNKIVTFKSKKPPKKRKKTFYNNPAWIWFARYMKIKLCNSQGLVQCATSGQLMRIGTKGCHLGHCIKVRDGNSTNYNVAFDERNVMPQTHKENTHHSGRPEVMRDKIDQKHGEGTYYELVRLSKIPKFLRESELKSISEEYKLKTYAIMKEKGLKKWW